MKYDLDKLRRYFNNGLSYVMGWTRVYGAPAHVHIEVTNICNFHCVYCPQSFPEEHFRILGRGKMPLKTYRQILDTLTASYNIQRVVLTRDGEPLVHPQLEDFVAYTTEKNIATTLGSNGSLSTEERAHK